jgi:hypothetical protein
MCLLNIGCRDNAPRSNHSDSGTLPTHRIQLDAHDASQLRDVTINDKCVRRPISSPRIESKLQQFTERKCDVTVLLHTKSSSIWTPRGRVILEKRTAVSWSKTLKFTTALTTAWARWIQSTLSYPVSFKICCYLCQSLLTGLFLSWSATETSYACLMYVFHATCSIHPIILALVTLVISGDEHKSRSSSPCSCLRSCSTDAQTFSAGAWSLRPSLWVAAVGRIHSNNSSNCYMLILTFLGTVTGVLYLVHCPLSTKNTVNLSHVRKIQWPCLFKQWCCQCPLTRHEHLLSFFCVYFQTNYLLASNRTFVLWLCFSSINQRQ